MEPLLVYLPGHALVAVRCWTGYDCAVPLETTKVGGGATVQQAVNAGIDGYKNALAIIDVKAERAKGYVPIPW
jgi:hypothetical protein